MAAPQDLARRFADLRVRTLSALVLAAAGGVAVWLGGLAFAVFVAALGGAIAWEWRSVTQYNGGPCGWAVSYLIAAVVGAALLTHLRGVETAVLWLGAVVSVGLIWDTVTSPRSAAFWTVVGGLYAGGAAIGLVWLRQWEPYGLNSVIWIILIVASADIGGYFAGKTLGGPKLWRAVSPKKTWSGSLGGIALACVLGLFFSWATSGTYYFEVCVVSALAAMVSQAGDLAESALKRHFGVKDASNLIPGHGGVLDRFDGLMAAAIVATVITAARDQTVFIW